MQNQNQRVGSGSADNPCCNSRLYKKCAPIENWARRKMYDIEIPQMRSNLKTPQSTPHGLRRIKLYTQNNLSVEYSPLAAFISPPRKGSAEGLSFISLLLGKLYRVKFYVLS